MMPMVYKRKALLPPYLRSIAFRTPEVPDNEGYPFTVPSFRQDFQMTLTKPITILVGDNATGKSTLLEYIASVCGFNLQGGSSDHVYQTHNHESFPHLTRLRACITLSWLPKLSRGFFFRSETFFNFIEYLHSPGISDGDHWLEKNYGGKLLEKSHGESFLKLFGVRFNRSGIYLLDEPESALSPMRQLHFLKILKDIENRQDSQVIMVTHSPILMSYPGADIISFSAQGIRPTSLQACEHYQFMKKFLENPDFYLAEVLDEG